jgi:hypothetical protein
MIQRRVGGEEGQIKVPLSNTAFYNKKLLALAETHERTTVDIYSTGIIYSY